MITELVRAIRLDEKRVIPVSTLKDGTHLGMKDACALPCRRSSARTAPSRCCCRVCHDREALPPSAGLREAIEEVGLNDAFRVSRWRGAGRSGDPHRRSRAVR